MSNGNSRTVINNSLTSPNYLISPHVEFWLYLIILIPSIICTLFILYYLLFNRILRRALNNHVIIVILITVLFCEITMYPWMLYYYFNNNTWQRSYIFCSIWAYIDWTFYVMQIALFGWASIERHILIFHDRWVATKKKRFFVHYLPIIIIVIYYLIFYGIVYFFPPCENTFNEFSMICISVCLYDSIAFHVFETIFNSIIPNLTIVIFSIALLLRILRQKQRMCQAIHWRKHRKMTIQLLSISFLYLVITCPYAFMIFLRICGLSNDIGVQFENWSIFFCYYIVLFFPFIAIFSVPECCTKIKAIFRLQRLARSIAPEILPVHDIGKNRKIVETII